MSKQLDWAFAHGGPLGGGRLRVTPEDFQVDEVPLVEPDGEGEHVLLHLRKRNTNTEFLARAIGRLAGVRPVDVSYAGLKDRQAVTTQWFSVRLAGREEPDWSALESDEVNVLAVARHGRKLRRGALKGNRFVLRIRELTADRGRIEARLQRLRTGGVPNYFGEQRFGRGGANLGRAAALFDGGRRERDRHRRGLYLSAARSYLFNRVLSLRVAEGIWDRALDGEVVMLDGRSSVFAADPSDPEVPRRVAAGELHPTGPLWGRGPSLAAREALAREETALAEEAAFRAGLEAAGLKQERRALRLPVRDLEWTCGSDTLEIAFRLDPGTYATVVIRELLRAEA